MAFIHTLHLLRLIFSLYTKYRTKSNACQGCLRCLLLDCYCCAGTIVYLYTQIAYFIDMGDCKEQLPHITSHMRHEIIYQYARIAWYFLTSLMVVLYIISIQKKFNDRKTEEIRDYEASKPANSVKLGPMLAKTKMQRMNKRA